MIPTMTLVDGIGAGSTSGASPTAPTSVVVSTTERRAVIYQNGKKAGDYPVQVSGSLARFKGEEVFLYAGDNRWHTIEGGDSFQSLSKDLVAPGALRDKLHAIVHPGTTMVVTSEPISVRGGTSRGVMGGE